MPRLLSGTSLLLVCATAALPQGSEHRAIEKAEARIAREVHHELVTLPYYSVFDDLAYKVEGYTVTLFGQVTRPTLKSDAEKRLRKSRASRA